MRIQTFYTEGLRMPRILRLFYLLMIQGQPFSQKKLIEEQKKGFMMNDDTKLFVNLFGFIFLRFYAI